MNIKKITLKDLRSLYDLKCWIREKCQIFLNKEIDKDILLIIINYLVEIFKNAETDNKEVWLDSLYELRNRANNLE